LQIGGGESTRLGGVKGNCWAASHLRVKRKNQNRREGKKELEFRRTPKKNPSPQIPAPTGFGEKKIKTTKIKPSEEVRVKDERGGQGIVELGTFFRTVPGIA